MGFFKSLGRIAKSAAKTVVAPAVNVVSPKAASQIRSTANHFETWGSTADTAGNRFTADVASTASGFARSTQTAFSEGGVITQAFSKDGLVTNFSQDYIPGGGFVTAIFHSAAGNNAYAQYAAVKGVSSSITTGFAVGGAMIGGPGGAVVMGAAGGGLASAWEGGMKNFISPEVAGRSRMNDLSVENIAMSAAIGGAAGLAGWGLAGAASMAGKGAASIGARASSMLGKATAGSADDALVAGAVGKAAAGSADDAFFSSMTRARSNTFARPMTFGERVGAFGMRTRQTMSRAGAAVLPFMRRGADYGKAGASAYAKRAAIGAGGGVVRTVAIQQGLPALVKEKAAIGWKKVAAGVGALAALLFGGVSLFGGGQGSSTTTLAAAPAVPIVVTTTSSSTTTQPPSTTTTATATTTPAPVIITTTTTTAPPTTTTTRPRATTTTTTTAPATTTTSTTSTTTTTTTTTIANAAPVIESMSAAQTPLYGPGYPASLSVTASDDGLPADPGALTYLWTQVGSSPEAVSFTDPSAASTSTGNLGACGIYTFMVTVSDGALTDQDTRAWEVTCG